MIDPRTLVPLDIETIVASVGEDESAAHLPRGRRRVAGRARSRCRSCERAFDDLDGPIVRVCGANASRAVQRRLEQAVIPGTADIVAAVRALLEGQLMPAARE